MRPHSVILAMGLVALSCQPLFAQATCSIDPSKVITIPAEKRVDKRTGETVIASPDKKAYRLSDGTVIFLGRMTIDADGHPQAYAPNNRGLDYTGNGGVPGNWWAIATMEARCPRKGTPVVRNLGSPPVPYYVSMTSMTNPAITGKDKCRTQENYVHSGEIPFVALPSRVSKFNINQNKGAVVTVYDTRPDKQKIAHALMADQGPPNGYGEGSIALANDLSIPSNPKTGGLASRDLLYIVHPEMSGFPGSAAVVRETGQSVFEKWGGKDRMQACLAALRALPN